MYKTLLRPLLFRFSPETIHHFSFRFLQLALALPGAKAVARYFFVKNDPRLGREVFGLRFANPVGLAAGFDKNAELVDELACLGFGFVEIGTLTPRPQPGNDHPRLFRLPADRALINRMGFNNHGSVAAAERLRRRKSGILIGGNLGKNKLTPNEAATEDYLACFRDLFDVVDYFVVNVSSPNTPGLRELQEKAPLTRLLDTLRTENETHANPKPILLKIAPDLNDAQLDDLIEVVRSTRTAGVIATNTTVNRVGLQTPAPVVEAAGAGGLSGPPVRDQSTHVIRYLVEKSGHAFPVIGVGGIETAADAREKLEAGASLVQLYTGFVYEGPGVARRICEGLLKN